MRFGFRRKLKKESNGSDNDNVDNGASVHSEESDAEPELDISSDDDRDSIAELVNDAENINPSSPPSQSREKAADITHNERSNKTPSSDMRQNKEALVEVVVKSSIKRKRVLASSDEEDNAPEHEAEEKMPTPELDLPDSPVSLKKKKHRVIVSDSDED
ncbi:unnamed protein product [Strongylus vulgaris]|uniref:Uncharacterized protein n=1 Tax=Strongylus vulgaris TaxID=40348 RepID=A0A3P7JZE5_STRVU|nr:unnamed protein product [Strongylus vulgaris]